MNASILIDTSTGNRFIGHDKVASTKKSCQFKRIINIVWDQQQHASSTSKKAQAKRVNKGIYHHKTHSSMDK